MAQTNACGSVAHLAALPATNVPNFLGVWRAIPLGGEEADGIFDAPSDTGAASARLRGSWPNVGWSRNVSVGTHLSHEPPFGLTLS